MPLSVHEGLPNSDGPRATHGRAAERQQCPPGTGEQLEQPDRARAGYGAGYVLVRPDGYVTVVADDPAGLPAHVHDIATSPVA